MSVGGGRGAGREIVGRHWLMCHRHGVRMRTEALASSIQTKYCQRGRLQQCVREGAHGAIPGCKNVPAGENTITTMANTYTEEMVIELATQEQHVIDSVHQPHTDYQRRLLGDGIPDNGRLLTTCFVIHNARELDDT